jgi:hypothetical protein
MDRRGFFKGLTGLFCSFLGIKVLPEKKQKFHWIEREDMDFWEEVDSSMNVTSYFYFFCWPDVHTFTDEASV